MADTAYENPTPVTAPEDLPENKQKKRKSAPGKFFTNDLAMCVIVLVAIALISGSLLGILNWVTYVDPEAAILQLVAKHYNINASQVVSAPDRVINAGGKDKVELCFIASNDSGNVLGIVYQAVGSGAKNGTLELLVYLSEDGIIDDIEEYSQSETAGYFNKVVKANKAKYIGLDVTEIESVTLNGNAPTNVDAVTNATYTSRGFNNAVNAAIYAFNHYEGGSANE